MKSTKQIVGVGLLTLVSASFAMAQIPTTSSSTYFWSNPKAGLQKMWNGNGGENRGKHNGDMKGKKKGHEKQMQKHVNKQATHEAIIAGDFAKFKAVASSTPIGKIDQTTFSNLSAQMKIIQAAKTQVDAILKAAGVERPFHTGGMHK